jgi:hypothetical protein
MDAAQLSTPFTNPLNKVSNFFRRGKRASSIQKMTWSDLCIHVLGPVGDYSLASSKPIITLGA